MYEPPAYEWGTGTGPGVKGSGAHRGQDHASHDVMAEFSKWLEAGGESIFCLETEKNLPGASYELREAAARTKKIPEIKLSEQFVEIRSGRSSL